jgi:histidinol-phosphate/aromatic aminotransferase/cobyric acid decarboxylase-like protein
MKFEMHTNIVTQDKEVRVDVENNLFELQVEGYHLYPLQEAVALYKSEKEKIGTAVPQNISWGNGQTVLRYQLISLHSVN